MTDVDSSPNRISRPEERQRLVSEALAQAEILDSAYRDASFEGTDRVWWAWLVAATLVVLAAWIHTFPPAWIRGDPLPSVTAGERERGLRAALRLQAQQIDAFRLREGRLPRSLDEVGTSLPGIRYVRSDSRVYQLVGFRPEGGVLVYDSAHPSPGFEAVAVGWMGAGIPAHAGR